MSQGETCPYCGVQLVTGDEGNAWRCILCGETLCTKCMRSGICARHFQELSPEQIIAIKKAYRNYNLTVLSATIGCFSLFIIGIRFFYPLFEGSAALSVLIIVMLGLLMMASAAIITKRARAITTKKMNEICPSE